MSFKGVDKRALLLRTCRGFDFPQMGGGLRRWEVGSQVIQRHIRCTYCPHSNAPEDARRCLSHSADTLRKVPMKRVSLNLPDDVIAALQKRSQETMAPVNAFIRRAITRELERPIIDAETERKPKLEDYYRPAVLITPTKE